MQKKHINKILIIAVALIWSLVMYKFATPYFSATDTVITADVLVNPKRNFIRKKDTFHLEIPDRDPFLGKITSSKKRKIVKEVSKPIKKSSNKKKEKITTWPKITYLGFVKSQKKTSKLGLVRINGVLKRVRKGMEISGVKIKKVEENLITIQFQKESRDFKK